VKAILSAILCVVICLVFNGCGFYSVDTDALLSPPQLSGEMEPICEALEKSVKEKYTLKYPTKGDLKSSVVTEDVDGDGVLEAFAFYSVDTDEQTTMHINVITETKKEYKSVDDQKISASGIEKIEFCDFDGNGTKEIIVGWEVYSNSEKQLQVFDFSSNALVVRFSQRYTEFATCDLDNNGETELFVQDLDTKKSTNIAAIYRLDQKGVSQIAACTMDGSVKTVDNFTVSKLSNEQPAVYIDEIKGIGAVTEVLYMKKGELVNPLLDIENSSENIKTLRASAIGYSDIDADGIIEIPLASPIPGADSNSEDEFYCTNWCAFNGEILNVKKTTIVNSVDGYYLVVPPRWTNSVSVSKDTNKRIRTIYRYDSKTKTTKEKIVTLRVLEKENYNKKKDLGYIKLGENNGLVCVAELSEYKGSLSVTEKEIKEMFCFEDYD